MNKLNKFFALMLCFVGAMSLVSCLNDDDNGGSGIDPQLYQQYMNSISGTYYGSNSDWRYENKIYFYNDTIKGNTIESRTDSVGNIVVAFSRDSTFAVSGVPGRLLAKEIPSEYQDLKDAIENAPNQTLRGRFVIFNITSPYAYYMLVPESITYPSLSYAGGSHKVSIAFYYPSSGIYGTVDNNTRQAVSLSLYVAAIYVDDKAVVNVFDGNISNTTDQARALLNVSATK